MTAILAPRFLASAFASGPSLLILLALILRRFTRFDAGWEAIQKLATIVAYAMVVNLFFVLVELFTGLYSDMPHHMHAFEYLFVGLEGRAGLVPWMWINAGLTVCAVVLLLMPRIRKQEKFLAPLCAAVVLAIWIEKGLAMVVTGFIPSPLGEVTEYAPTAPEVAITLGVYALGFFVLTVLYRVVVNVRERLEVT
jgi:molybdopterin-containing oxidoreductase family membrane subunit